MGNVYLGVRVVHVGAAGEEELDGGELPLEAGPPEAGETLGVRGVEGGSALQQQLHQANVALSGGNHQSRATSGVGLEKDVKILILFIFFT